jgi:hypothetical protein
MGKVGKGWEKLFLGRLIYEQLYGTVNKANILYNSGLHSIPYITNRHVLCISLMAATNMLPIGHVGYLWLGHS